jgi:hypothetical protein
MIANALVFNVQRLFKFLARVQQNGLCVISRLYSLRSGGCFGFIRRELVEAEMGDAVIANPPRLFIKQQSAETGLLSILARDEKSRERERKSYHR